MLHTAQSAAPRVTENPFEIAILAISADHPQGYVAGAPFRKRRVGGEADEH